MPSHSGRVLAPPSGRSAPVTLDRLAPGSSAVVLDVAASRYELLREGIRAGRLLLVAAHAPFGGPTIVELGGARVALSRDVARSITVRVEDAPRGKALPDASAQRAPAAEATRDAPSVAPTEPDP